MTKMRFIVNPVSGVGKQRVIEGLVQKGLDRSKYEAEIVYTEAAGHATELAHEAAQQNVPVVVAVGGDGSVNEVGRGLINTESAMGILPAGSGNGLARHLNIPTDLTAAIQTLNRGQVQKIDTASLNGEPFLGVAGIGFDAHIGWEFSTYGKRGFSTYVKIVLKEYPKYKPNQYKLLIDGKTYEREAFLISFANSSQYGNNASIAPLADIQDGLLDICILSAFPAHNAPRVIWRLFNNSLHQSPYLEVLHGKQIEVQTSSPILHLDGEPVKMDAPLSIRIHPLSLRVVV